MAEANWNDFGEISGRKSSLASLNQKFRSTMMGSDDIDSETKDSPILPNLRFLREPGVPPSVPKSSLHCDPCQYRNNKLEAAFGFCQTCCEHLCMTCYTTHRRPQALKNHVLLDSVNMPKMKSSEISEIQICERHKDKLIEYYCKNCDELGCSVCITLNHTHCDKDYISDITRGSKPCTEYSQLLQDLDFVTYDCKKIHTSAKREKHVKEEREMISKEIKAFREEINRQLDYCERQLEQENEEIHNEEQVTAQSVASESKELHDRAKKLQQNLLKVLEDAGGNDNLLYITVKRDKKVLRELKKQVKDLEANQGTHECKCKFNRNESTLKEMSENALGDLSVVKSGVKQKHSKSLFLPKPRPVTPGILSKRMMKSVIQHSEKEHFQHN